MSSKKQGNSFEEEIEDEAEKILRPTNTASIFLVPQRVKILRRKGAMITRGHVEQSTFVDFSGHWKRRSPYPGIKIAFDAKSTKKDRFEHSAIKDEQLEWLREVAEDGGTAFIYVKCAKGRYVLPVGPEGILVSAGKFKYLDTEKADWQKIKPGQTWADWWIQNSEKAAWSPMGDL